MRVDVSWPHIVALSVYCPSETLVWSLWCVPLPPGSCSLITMSLLVWYDKAGL